MSTTPDPLLNKMFFEARTHNGWLDRSVDENVLRSLYEMVQIAPTSANSQPTRFVFLNSPSTKEKLKSALAPGNVDKTMSAPVTAIIAYDMEFHENMHRVLPILPAMKDMLMAMPADARDFFLVQNSSLQAGYFILAARALGLDCGPMAGFDRAKVDEIFFSGTTWKSIMLINLGYGDSTKLFPRNPRLSFEEACRILS